MKPDGKKSVNKKKRKQRIFRGPFGWSAKRPLKWKYDEKKGSWNIQEVLEDFLKSHEMYTPFREAMVLDEMQELLGEEFMAHMRPHSFSSGVLVCMVDSPVWNQQYTMMKRQILDRLNTGTRTWKVRDIRFKVGSFPDSQYLLKEEENDSKIKASIQQQSLSDEDRSFINDCLDGMPPDLGKDVRDTLETILKYQTYRGASEDGSAEERL